MNRPNSTRRTRMALVIAFLWALSQASQAADFYAIIDNYGKKPLNAYVDISVDNIGGPLDIDFDVFSEVGGQVAEFTVRTNDKGLASTASVVNLFDLTVGQPMLVRARTSADATPAAGMLHMDSRGTPLTIALWPTHRRSDGTGFAIGHTFDIALGSFRLASLLIASVGGGEQVVDIHVGTRGSEGSGIYSTRLGPNAIWRIDLSQNEALSNLIVSSSGAIAVQVMIDDGTKPQSFVVLPSN